MKYVISLGGSIINPGKIEVKFLKAFRKLILAQLKKGHQFFIVTGGGKITRDYQAALKKITNPSNVDLDWMGIAPTKLNAEFVRLIFGRHARRELIIDPTKRYSNLKPINLVTGWKPGRSTDDDAVRIAKNQGVETVINLTNIDYVYSKDPKKYKGAKKIKRLAWNQYLKIVGQRWRAGANFPFGPTAAKYASQHKVTVIILNGRKLKNFQRFLAGEKFRGTVIE